MSYGIYGINLALPLRNEEYFDCVSDLVRSTTRRLWITMFIMDIRIMRDPYLCVRRVCEELIYARWRNVDVRLVIGMSDDSHDIAHADLTAALYLNGKGIPVRIFDSEDKSSLHSKYVVADFDTIVVGSHNWTHGGFFGHIEDSMLISSVPLNCFLAAEFETIWNSSKEVSSHENNLVQ